MSLDKPILTVTEMLKKLFNMFLNGSVSKVAVHETSTSAARVEANLLPVNHPLFLLVDLYGKESVCLSQICEIIITLSFLLVF